MQQISKNGGFKVFSSGSARNLSGTANKVLVIAEQNKGKLQNSTLSSIGAGLALKAGDVDVLVIGGGEGEEVLNVDIRLESNY